MGNAIIVEPYDIPAISAEGSAAGTVPGNLNNDWMGVVHRGTSTTTGASILCDLGSARSVDTLAVLSARTSVSTIQIGGGSSFGNADLYNSGSVTFPAGATLPTSGRQNSLQLLSSPVTARYWLNTFGTLSGGPFEAGRWVIGKRYQPARNFTFGAAFGTTDRGGGDFSAQGVWLPKPGAIQRTVGLSFSNTTRQEAETNVAELLDRIGNRKHILIVTDPDANALRQRRMFFGPLIGSLDRLWRVADGWEWRANLVSSI